MIIIPGAGARMVERIVLELGYSIRSRGGPGSSGCDGGHSGEGDKPGLGV